MLSQQTKRSSRVVLLSASLAFGLVLSVGPPPTSAQVPANEVFGSDNFWSANKEQSPECESLNRTHQQLTQQMTQSRDAEANRELAQERAPVQKQLLKCKATVLQGKVTEPGAGGTYPDPRLVPTPHAPSRGTQPGPRKPGSPQKPNSPQQPPSRQSAYVHGILQWNAPGGADTIFLKISQEHRNGDTVAGPIESKTGFYTKVSGIFSFDQQRKKWLFYVDKLYDGNGRSYPVGRWVRLT